MQKSNRERSESKSEKSDEESKGRKEGVRIMKKPQPISTGAFPHRLSRTKSK